MQAIRPPDLQHQLGHGRVEMEMLVRVDVIQPQAGVAEDPELRLYLARELIAHARPQENGGSQAHHISAKGALLIDEIGNVRRRQNRSPFYEDKMESYA